MRVSLAALPTGMAVDGFVPGANYVNAHVRVVHADRAAVWRAAHDLLDEPPIPFPADVLLTAAAVARGEGISGTAGFEIEVEDEGTELVLSGAHRYATYVTNLYLEPTDEGSTRLWNVSRARFSRSIAGRLYLAGVHVFHDVLVEGLLRRLQLTAEARERVADVR